MPEPRGVWLLPTRGRVANLRRFLSAAREMGTQTVGWVLVDEDDYQANELAYGQAMALAEQDAFEQSCAGFGEQALKRCVEGVLCFKQYSKE